jgi:DNA-binding PadR family transcriptional regulator
MWGRPASGPGFRWRFFDRGDLKFVILRLLRDRPMHGYDVMRALEEESGGCYRASAGSVYPTLQLLEDQGLVRSEEREGKKVYVITDAGRAHLEENRDVVDEIFERVSTFAQQFVRAEAGELTRSFTRLAQATFERAVKYPGDVDVLKNLKDILDRALHDVEGVRPPRAAE